MNGPCTHSTSGWRDADAVDVRAVAALIAHFARGQDGLKADRGGQRQDGLWPRRGFQVVRDDVVNEAGHLQQVCGE